MNEEAGTVEPVPLGYRETVEAAEMNAGDRMGKAQTKYSRFLLSYKKNLFCAHPPPRAFRAGPPHRIRGAGQAYPIHRATHRIQLEQ